MSTLPPVLLGHNQFFGVDHLSAARGAARARMFSETARILDLIEMACELGAGGLMISTHERSIAVCEAIHANPGLSSSLSLYPLLPYVQKFVTKSNEVGLVNMGLDLLSGMSIGAKISTIWRSGRALLTQDTDDALRALIRIELKPFRYLDCRAVFLHDALTDMALALELESVFRLYMAEIPAVIGAEAGFATKNLPLFLERFTTWGLPKPIVMTHFNRIGFQMNPSRDACEEAARRHRPRILAMGTLASGHLTPDEAFDYLSGIESVESVVVGASSRAHLEQTLRAALRAHELRRTVATGARASNGR